MINIFFFYELVEISRWYQFLWNLGCITAAVLCFIALNSAQICPGPWNKQRQLLLSNIWKLLVLSRALQILASQKILAIDHIKKGKISMVKMVHEQRPLRVPEFTTSTPVIVDSHKQQYRYWSSPHPWKPEGSSELSELRLNSIWLVLIDFWMVYSCWRCLSSTSFKWSFFCKPKR
jgi:hypothetical protein